MTKCDKCHSFAINQDPDRNLCDVCYYKIPLFNLLAVIHRDGGHYVEDHGVKKAVRDAIEILYNVETIPSNSADNVKK